jgi:hypothetical protein
MKYGVLVHKTTKNFGDDVQSYAIKQFLPHVDYYIDRENVDEFKSENNEPVATIMAAWWMWQKWNWPPNECIIPKLISMHFNNYTFREKASPIQNEWLQGIGKQFFDAYGPVGVRDKSSVEFLNENGIDNYFSGCITLTLPKQKETENKGKYVVIADLKPALENKVREWLKDSGLEIIKVSHDIKYKSEELPYDERFQKVEDILTLYQNAKFVVTRRLHITLPCLAMEVPVMSIVDLNQKRNSTRWEPYCDWVNYVSEEDLLSGNFEFDYNNPPANKKDYLPIRENLIKEINSFISEMEAFGDAPVEQVKKTTYTEEEARAWQFTQMRNTLDEWLRLNRGLLADLAKEKRKNKKLKLEIKNLKNQSVLKKSLQKIKKILHR